MSSLINTVPSYSSSDNGHKASQRNSSVKSTRSLKNGIKYLARKLKEHERQSQTAWKSYYGFPSQAPRSHPQSYRRESTSSSSSSTGCSAASFLSSTPSADRSSSAVKKAWSSVKKAAKAHHQATNAAYATYYGDGRLLAARSAEINRHSVPY